MDGTTNENIGRWINTQTDRKDIVGVSLTCSLGLQQTKKYRKSLKKTRLKEKKERKKEREKERKRK